MADPLNPQAREMADESMVRTLAAQADAIWPQEAPLFDRYQLPSTARILDGGCGTGEITMRLAERYPDAHLLGVDVIDEHLERGRRRCATFGDRVRFEHRSVFELGLPGGSFDLVVCRHVLQAIPHPERAIAELVRVTRRGGWVHLLSEDYLMINFEPRRLDPDDFWSQGPRAAGDSMGVDLRIGRRTYGILQRLGLVDIAVDYVIVDPLRVPRETIAQIWIAWRDGFADIVAANSPVSRQQFIDYFDDMIATIRDPDAYGVWHVPVIGARIPS